MENYFPADVSLRVVGNDIDGAQRLYPVARQLLFKALRIQSLGGKQNVNLFIPGTDGSLVSVVLSGNLKHLYVKPASRVSRGTTQEEAPEFTKGIPVYVPMMVHGLVRKNPALAFSAPWVIEELHTPDPSIYVLSDFHPDSVTSSIYAFDLAWQNIEQLGITKSGAVDDQDEAISSYPKTSMFSGSMTLFYQALLGLGKVKDVAETGYISGELPTTDPDVVVFPQFSWTWLRTHGIYIKEGALWLIEISKADGILAMPAPLFTPTKDPNYLDWLVSIGDTNTANVAEKFGGIPTGEPMPTGAALTAALAEGKVIRLMTAVDLLPFYEDADTSIVKTPFYEDCGWAFSTIGEKAVNTAFWYRNPGAVFALATEENPIPPEPSNAEDKHMIGELWEISIALPPINSEGIPGGSGSAILTRLRQEFVPGAPDFNCWWKQDFGLIYYDIKEGICRVPTTSQTERVKQFLSFRSFVNDNDNWIDLPWAPLFAFYIGEVMEVVERGSPLGSYPGKYMFDSNTNTYTHQRGTSLDYALEFASSGGDPDYLQSIHLIVPYGCREGYILFRTVGTNDAIAKGFFGQLGVVEFPQETFTNDWFYGFSVYYNGVIPKSSFSEGVDDSFDAIYSAAVINAGASPWYVMSTILNDGEEPASSYTYTMPVSQGELDVPDNTPAGVVNFVGSP